MTLGNDASGGARGGSRGSGAELLDGTPLLGSYLVLGHARAALDQRLGDLSRESDTGTAAQALEGVSQLGGQHQQ